MARSCEVDPFDEAARDRLARHGASPPTCTAAGTCATPWRLAEMLVAVQAEQTRPARKTLYAGVEDGRVVVAASSRRRYIDNLDHAHAAASTPIPTTGGAGTGRPCSPTWSRWPRGHGRTVLDAEARLAVRRRRRTARAPRRPSSCTRRGYRFGLGDVHRVLDLPVDDGAARRAGRRGGAAPRGVHAPVVGRAGARRHRRELRRARGAADGRGAHRRPRARARERRRRCPAAHARSSRASQGRTTYNTRRPGRRRRGGGLLQPRRSRPTTPTTPSSGARWSAAPTAATGSGWRSRSATLRLLQQGEVRARRLHTWNAEVNEHMIGDQRAAGLPAGRADRASSRRSSSEVSAPGLSASGGVTEGSADVWRPASEAPWVDSSQTRIWSSHEPLRDHHHRRPAERLAVEGRDVPDYCTRSPSSRPEASPVRQAKRPHGARQPVRACAAGRSAPSGRGPCAAPASRGTGSAGCSAPGSGR